MSGVALTAGVFLLLLSLSISAGAWRTQVPFCKTLLQGLNDQQLAGLRDAVQVHGQFKRKAITAGLYLRKNRELQEGKIKENVQGVKIAYKTNLSLPELEAKEHEAVKAEIAALSRLHSAIEALQKQGALSSTAQPQHVRACAYGRANTHLFEYRPRVSFLMQHFKRPTSIRPMTEAVLRCGQQLGQPVELVVNVDHPQDAAAWANQSAATNGLVVPVISGNIHEIRSYNRLARIARGDFLIIAADDDVPTSDCSWLGEVVRLFERFPEVGMVGLRHYRICYSSQFNRGDWFKDPGTGITTLFVQQIDMAPMAVRRAAMLGVGGMDETMSEPGECGIISDWELSNRMWIGGWQILHLKEVPMEKDHAGGPGGTHTSANQEKCWGKQMGVGGAVMGSRTSNDFEDHICEAARVLNLQHLQLLDETKCPYPDCKKLAATAV